MQQYRYAFQGQELDPETGMEAFQLRLWDGRIGRWLSPDPYGQFSSPYVGMGNNPVSGIDPDGGFYYPGGNGTTVGQTHTDSDGSWKWDGSIWKGQNGAIDCSFVTLRDVVINNRPKANTSNLFGIDYSRLPSSGAYGWNDGSAERFWNETMPITSDLFDVISGIQEGNSKRALKGTLFTVINVFSFGEGGTLLKGGGAVVETYALRAGKSGLYPVMSRGFGKATELVYLEAGEVWKYGITKNPLTRYTQKYLNNLGEFGVKYEKLFESTLRSEALTVEKMMIQQYERLHGFLPAGNKVIF